MTADFGIVGLGRMGANLALQALERGFAVAGYTRGDPPHIEHPRFTLFPSVATMLASLAPPQRVMIYIPAGGAVDELLDQLGAQLSAGAIVMDGGNSYWGDSIRRAERLRGRGVHFLDVGTSGGVTGARHGACFMVGGRDDAVEVVAPVLRRLAVPGGFVHAGGPGAGHFVKLVHNGIEFGMLQAIGEGVALLSAYPEPLSVPDIAECWRHGSVIRSWLVDLLEEQLRTKRLDQVPPIVEDTGEVNWLVADALELEVPTPVINQAVSQLVASRNSAGSAARAVALMRHGFGGHPFGPSPELRRERRTSRIGGFVAPKAGKT